MTTLIVIAKECLPGKVKTRLCPPLTYQQAAHLASASLTDTLTTATTLPATRKILLFDGERPPAEARDFEVIPQVSGGLDERLGAIFDLLDEPAVLIGMDTPQITHELLAPMFEEWPTGCDAWFGPANDGGFWALGLREPNGDLVRGVPMSQTDTGNHQLNRLARADLDVTFLPELVDVDTIDDAELVAQLAPETLFARTLAACGVHELASVL
jgi:uncharacterized protein